MVERNLAKVEVESSRLFSRSTFHKGKPRLPFFVDTGRGSRDRLEHGHWRDSKAVMHRIANPISPGRLRVAPPVIYIVRRLIYHFEAVLPAFCFTMPLCARVVKLVDTSDLKSAAFLHKERTGSIPVPGTIYLNQAASRNLKYPHGPQRSGFFVASGRFTAYHQIPAIYGSFHYAQTGRRKNAGHW